MRVNRDDGGTESYANELAGEPEETGSYTIGTATGDDDDSMESGTEVLGEGGKIASGGDTVSWHDGHWAERDLSVTGIDAILDISDWSTDSDGFGESGSQVIGEDGRDLPGELSFDWDQLGGDDYQINQEGDYEDDGTYGDGDDYSSDNSYSLDLTDTFSASWKDTGIESLGHDDAVAGETDHYTWADLHSITYDVVASSTYSEGDGEDGGDDLAKRGAGPPTSSPSAAVSVAGTSGTESASTPGSAAAPVSLGAATSKSAPAPTPTPTAAGTSSSTLTPTPSSPAASVSLGAATSKSAPAPTPTPTAAGTSSSTLTPTPSSPAAADSCPRTRFPVAGDVATGANADARLAARAHGWTRRSDPGFADSDARPADTNAHLADADANVADTHTDTHTNTHTDTDTHTHADVADTNADSDPNVTHADTNANIAHADANVAHADTDTHTNIAHANTHTDAHANLAHADAYTNADVADAHTHTHADTDTHAHTDADAYTNADPNANADPNTDTHTNTHPHTDAHRHTDERLCLGRLPGQRRDLL